MLTSKARGSTRLLRSAWAPKRFTGVKTTRASSTLAEQQHQQWKAVYRAFLLRVHPDFFQESPKKRAVNEKSLKSFSQHLDRLERGDSNSRSKVANGNTPPLVFFLKQAGRGEQEEDGSSTKDGTLSLRKVLLPLGSHLQMATLLYEAGVTPTSVTPPSPQDLITNPSRPADSNASESNSNTSNNSGWDSWEDELFGGTAANRAWDEAAASGNQWHTHGRSPFSSDGDGSREGRQRTTQWGAAFERSGDGASQLGRILSTDAGRSLVRERRSSSRIVQRLVKELREHYGFGEFTFRCGWSKSNLRVSLGALLETCHAHRQALVVTDFGGLEVVFRNDPSDLHEEEIRLCPADVPNQWLLVLQRVTPAVLSIAEERSREMVSLEGEASSVLRGARLSRGLSCSKSRYREFLREVCTAAGSESDEGGGGGTATDMALSDWSVLRCRVEEGFGRVSTVLEDGTIQVGSDMTLGTLRRCLGRDLTRSSAVAAESLKLAAAAAATADRCRRSLGLEAIERSRRAVCHSQMVVACEALVRFNESTRNGDSKAEAVAARRRLRGHSVRVVGSRVGVCDGVTDDGEIAIPWNWAGEEGGEERQSSAPFVDENL